MKASSEPPVRARRMAEESEPAARYSVSEEWLDGLAERHGIRAGSLDAGWLRRATGCRG
jgi:hypothetical protein